MTDHSKGKRELLRNYLRPLVHIRDQFKDWRFGLILGAGINSGVGLPTWNQLVLSISKDDQVLGEDIIAKTPPRAALTYKTEMLFQHYRKKRYAVACPLGNEREFEFMISAEWLKIVRDNLYKDAKDDFTAILDSHLI